MKKGLISITALVAAALPVVALSSVAMAQPAPQPAPVIGGPGAPNAEMSATPAQAPQPDQAAPAQGTAKPAEPDPLIWRGTTFTWNQSVTTTTLGVGRDNIGYEDDYYGWDFTLAPQLYLLDLPDDKLSLSAEAGVAVEWTNAADTTTRNEPYFKDVQFGVGYNRNIFTTEDKEWSTRGGVRARAVFPSSPISQAQGKYLTSALGVTLAQQFRLLGRAADGLNNLTVTGGFTWSHLFSRSYTPTNDSFARTRQNASFQSIDDDQIGTRSLDIDRLTGSITFGLPLIKDLSLTTAFRIVGRFKHKFEGTGCDVVVMDECVTADREADAPTYFTNSTFDIALTQPIYEIIDINLGYNNDTTTLGEDGKNRNIFYSPGAQFYLDLVANIDVIYAKAVGRESFAMPEGPGIKEASAANSMPSF